jgi:Flp pilus assembly protein TadB
LTRCKKFSSIVFLAAKQSQESVWYFRVPEKFGVFRVRYSQFMVDRQTLTWHNQKSEKAIIIALFFGIISRSSQFRQDFFLFCETCRLRSLFAFFFLFFACLLACLLMFMTLHTPLSFVVVVVVVVSINRSVFFLNKDPLQFLASQSKHLKNHVDLFNV